MLRRSTSVALMIAASSAAACGTNAANPVGASAGVVRTSGSNSTAYVNASATGRGPETPPFNIEAVLRPSASDSNGFGLIKFRQPNDGLMRIFLDTWVRDLAPNSEYRLQRAVDTVLDGNCTSTAWLTLGMGTSPLTLATDDTGTARASFYRDLPSGLALQEFDIHFRIVTLGGSEVLHSGCYQFVAEPD